MGFFDTPPQTSTSTSGPAAWTQPYWDSYLQGTQNAINNTNFSPYGGPTVAPQTQSQNTAGDMMYNLATGGSPAGNMANAAITAQASGAIVNPYATLQNPWEGQQNSVAGQTNPYAGDNPYLQQQIDATAGDMAKYYSQGIAAQTDGAFNQAGAFGGSAYQNQVNNNQDTFAKNLGSTIGGLRYNNYLNSGQLAQNDLARNASISGQDLARNSGLAGDTLNRATGAFQNQSQNQLQAAQLGLQSQGVDLNAINNLYNMGSAQQGYTQNVLNGAQNQYSQQQQAPFVPLDIMGNSLSRIPGGTTTSSVGGTQGSPALNAIGLIGSLYGTGIIPGFGG